MMRKLVIGVLLMGLAVVLWNEYRLWSRHSQQYMLRMRERRQAEKLSNTADEVGHVPAMRGDFHLIELSLRPIQTPEPSWADSEEPARLPTTLVHAPSSAPTIIPARFEKAESVKLHLAGSAQRWLCLGPCLIPLPTVTATPGACRETPSSPEPESLFVMPRLLNEPRH
jgi:hypothetical protein